MKPNKIRNFLISVLIIALLISTASGSFTMAINIENDQTVNHQDKGFSLTVRAKKNFIRPSRLIIPQNTNNIIPLSEDNDKNNILVTGTLGDEYNPVMVTHDDKALVAYEYKNGDATNIRFRSSTNYGRNWSNLIEELGVDTTSPSLTIHPTRDFAYGIFISTTNNSAILYDLLMDGITQPSNWDGGIFDWTYDPDENAHFWGFSDNDIVYVTVAGENKYRIHYIAALIGSTDYPEGETEDSIMFLYRHPKNPEELATLTWDPSIQNCSNLSITVDDPLDSNIIYGVCEIDNGTNKDLLFFEYTDLLEDCQPLSHKIINRTENLIHPEIYYENGILYIIAESDNGSARNLVLINSSNLGKNWSEPIIINRDQTPIANFSYEIQRLNVTFSDESFDMDGNIQSWSWEFGEGGSSTVENPTHDYLNAGSYMVNLTVYDNHGYNNTISKTITVNDVDPIADFTYDPINLRINENITFNSTSIAAAGFHIENYTWDFGDGTNLSYNKTVQHQYQSNGTYIVNLTIRDNVSRIDSVEKTIKVGLVADFIFSPTIPKVGQSVIFICKASYPSGEYIKKFSWNFGDGGISSAIHPVHKYSNPGVYNVKFTITSNINTTDTIIKQITVRPDVFKPRDPELYVKNNNIFCTFTLNGNIFITNSSDMGENWSSYTMLNSQRYTVAEQYRYSHMVDPDRILWTDYRNGNYDIYLYMEYVPTFDLVILNISLYHEPQIITTVNEIEIKVKNLGTGIANNIMINVSYEDDDGEITYLEPVPMREIDSNEIEFPRYKLFSGSLDGYVRALINFAGISNVTVILEVEGDTNTANNADTLPVDYVDLFPIIGRFPFFEDIFKLLQ